MRLVMCGSLALAMEYYIARLNWIANVMQISSQCVKINKLHWQILILKLEDLKFGGVATLLDSLSAFPLLMLYQLIALFTGPQITSHLLLNPKGVICFFKWCDRMYHVWPLRTAGRGEVLCHTLCQTAAIPYANSWTWAHMNDVICKCCHLIHDSHSRHLAWKN